MFKILSWIAVVILSASYWAQVWRIHIHKEVRDLSFNMYLGLAIGFTIMLFKAISEGSVIFAVKQLATLIPCLIIAAQIIQHKDDSWED